MCRGNLSFAIVDCQLPIYTTEFRILLQSEIGNQKSAMRKPRAVTTRGLSSNLIRAAVERLAELFSGFFYVAASRLNSPRFCQGLLKHRSLEVSRQQWHAHLARDFRAGRPGHVFNRGIRPPIGFLDSKNGVFRYARESAAEYWARA
jgi:hypothetical protein